MNSKVISVDLIRDSYRSDSFPKDWPREARERSLRRYEKWLLLVAKHPKTPFAPTRDIDLFWHLHMLSPVAYYKDCLALFGAVLDHDGGFGKQPEELPVLRSVFERTALLWQAMFDEPYREDGRWLNDEPTSCWHDCSGRCWHACSSKLGEAAVDVG